MTTFQNLIDRTTTRLSMANGQGVQIYSEDVIAEMIQHKFDVLFEEMFWPQFCDWYTWALDGTNGIVTTDLTDILKRFDDIQIIYPENSNRALTKIMARTNNPNLYSGTSPLFYEALGINSAYKTSRVFRVWPLGSTGNINARIRHRPDPFTPTDEVDFDDQALILGATYDYLEDDGTNPSATQKFQNLFETRVSQLKKSHSSGPISLDPVSSRPNTSTFTELP